MGEAEHALIHAVPRLTAASVHTDHTSVGRDPHAVLGHHAEHWGLPRGSQASRHGLGHVAHCDEFTRFPALEDGVGRAVLKAAAQ